MERMREQRSNKSMAPVHCVIIHEGPVTLQVELAESEHTQSYKRHSEHQSKQRVRGTTAFCNTAKHKVKNMSDQV